MNQHDSVRYQVANIVQDLSEQGLIETLPRIDCETIGRAVQDQLRPRVVETVDQLASLPDGVWIRDRAGDIGIKNDWPLDLAVHYPILGHWKANATIPVPATVLYVPEEAK
ncbi:hypothetical protein [Promicromonospora sukumoe]